MPRGPRGEKRPADAIGAAIQRIDYLILTLKSYRDGPRPGADTAMSAGVAGLTDPDLAALAHYAASR